MLSRWILRFIGWKIIDNLPYRTKCVICVAPHTSNWDFILGQLAYSAIGRRSCFLMKKDWFFFPIGYILKSLGGVPVDRSRHTRLSDQLVKLFEERPQLNLAITPEGTRHQNRKWHTGFLHIAYNAGVPVQCGVIDYMHKTILLEKEFIPTGNIENDMNAIKDYYKPFGDVGRHPDKFSL